MAEQQFKHYRDFYFPVLRIIRDMGGKARLADIRDRFLVRHKHQLDPSFFTETKDRDIMWRDYIDRAGFELSDAGYIVRPTRGLWELTDKPWPANKEDF
jgi:hypothetical protein